MGTASKEAERKIEEFRNIVGNVIGELRSQEVRKTYASITLPEILDQQIKFLTGDGKTLGRRQRLEAMNKAFADKLQAIKDTSPAAFRYPDPKADVNT